MGQEEKVLGGQRVDKFNKEGDCPSWTHPAPHLCPSSTVCLHRVDNNHLLLLMIHVFRENEEQLFRVRWSQSISHEGPLCACVSRGLRALLSPHR